MKSLAFAPKLCGDIVDRPSLGNWWEWDNNRFTWGDPLPFPQTLVRHELAASVRDMRLFLQSRIMSSGSEHILVFWRLSATRAIEVTAFMSEVPSRFVNEATPRWAHGLRPVRTRAQRLLALDT